jgi:hypothetical protein
VLQTEEEKAVKVGFKRLFGMVAKDWPFLISGGITSAILGCVMPLFAVILSTIITSLDPREPESKANNVRLRHSLDAWNTWTGAHATSTSHGRAVVHVASSAFVE